MNRSIWKTTLREIRASLGRYLAIFAIIALGVGFFAGLKVTGKTMVDAANRFLIDHEMYDFRMISTLGLVDEDIDAVRQMPEVKNAAGAYQADAVVTDGDREFVVRFHSLTDNIDTPSLTAGRMPEISGEVIADARYYSESDIGKTVCLADTNTDDSLDSFSRTEFTITGLAYSPLYLNYERGTTSVGNGSVTYFFFILPEDFNIEVYTDIYLTLNEGGFIFSDEYDDAIERIKPRMEDMLNERARIRYDGLYSDARSELDEAQEKLSDADRKLADAKAEIEDAEKEISDGKIEIGDGSIKLAEAKQELADGEKQLADAKKEIEDGEKQLEDGKKEIADGEKQLEDAKKEIEDGEKQLEDGKKEIADGEKQLTSGRQELEEGKKQLEEAKLKIKAGLEELEIKEAELEDSQKQIDAAQKELDKAKAEYAAYEAFMTPEQKEQSAKKIAETEAGLSAAIAEIEAGWLQINAAKEQFKAGEAEMAEKQAELDEAEKLIAEKESVLKSAKKEIEKKEKVLENAKKTVSENEADIENAKSEIAEKEKELADARKEIADKATELEDAKKEIAEKESDLEDARIKIADAEKELEDGKAEIADKEAELADAKAEVADAEAELADFTEPTTYLLTRDENIGYACFENDSKIVDGIAVVFPVFFFLVAALVCVTTMSRMIEEQRTQIGVLKALGYSEATVMSKYIFYSGSAALLGGVSGFFIGCYAFPTIIWKVYGLMYGFTDIRFVFSPMLFTISITVALICSVGTTFISCKHDLSRVAAELIRPKSPKSGKRILLERITFIWRRIKFLRKVSIRNIFRYKGRFVMMLLGIGGCAGLILTGFGIRDSITEIADEQYTRILVYDELVNFSESLSEEEIKDFRDEYSGSLKAFMPVSLFSVDPVDTGSIRSVNMVLMASEENWTDLLLLHDKKSGEQLSFPGPGEVIVTHNVAKINSLSVGDTITFRDSDYNEFHLKVSGICDNYFNSYAYISADTYAMAHTGSFSFYAGESPGAPYKSAFVCIKDGIDLHEAAASFMNHEKVSSVNVNRDTLEMFSKMMQTMNYIVVLVIFCAAALAFIVLYNLTNINITERIREIATIKVLGFYASETAAYVFRENLALTAIGAVVGIPIGIWLHSFVMSNIKIDMVTFDVHINPPSYLYALLFTFSFAILVDFVMFFKLKRINMAESLKSIE